MKHLLTVLIGLLVVIGMNAERSTFGRSLPQGRENFPYRSDYLWVTVPDHAVWNLLKCEKESLVTPVNEHWTSDVTNRQQLDWILHQIQNQ